MYSSKKLAGDALKAFLKLAQVSGEVHNTARRPENENTPDDPPKHQANDVC